TRQSVVAIDSKGIPADDPVIHEGVILGPLVQMGVGEELQPQSAGHQAEETSNVGPAAPDEGLIEAHGVPDGLPEDERACEAEKGGCCIRALEVGTTVVLLAKIELGLGAGFQDSSVHEWLHV